MGARKGRRRIGAAAAREQNGRASRSRTSTRTTEETHTTTPPREEGSELNNVSGGSPSSGESPLSRKKPRMEEKGGVSEIDMETREPEIEQEEEEKRVLYFSQYLCISLWRALQSCEIWDSRLVTAFCQGPKVFTTSVHTLAKNVHRRVDQLQTKSFVHNYISKLRPKGLYSSCAKIFQKAQVTNLIRSLKRKTPEIPSITGKLDDNDEDENLEFLAVNDGKYKHRFIMEEPRLMVVNGPLKDKVFEKTG